MHKWVVCSLFFHRFFLLKKVSLKTDQFPSKLINFNVQFWNILEINAWAPAQYIFCSKWFCRNLYIQQEYRFFFYLMVSDLALCSKKWLLTKQYLRCEHKTKNRQFSDKFWRHLLLSQIILDFQNWANWDTILKCLFQL